jgi:hypothetical protein
MENSSFGRLISVLISPKATFESIRERPTWLVAFLVICLVGATVGFLVHQRTDYAAVTAHQMEARGQDVPAEQMEQMVAMQEKFGGILVPVVTPLFVGFFFSLVSLIYWVGGKVGGADPSFKQMFSVTTYSSAPTIVAALLQAIVIFPKKELAVEQIVNRNFLAASNLALLAPDGASGKLVAMLAGLDFFAIWATVLAFLGLKVVGRMSTAVAAVLAALIFLAGIGLRVLFA